MNGLEQIYDDCLEHETDILNDAEELRDKRIRAYQSGDKAQFKEIIPVLNAVMLGAERYMQYIIEEVQNEQRNII